MPAVLLLSTLSFGQMSVSNAQRADCSRAKEALKKDGTDPDRTLKELRALLADLQQACGTPDESQPVSDIRKVVADCSKALSAFDKNITAPDLPMDEFNALIAAAGRDCRTGPAAHGVHDKTSETDSRPIPETKDSPKDSPTLDIHQLLAKSVTALNREIALGNRLAAHFQRAQTWEGIDANHPDAVALREKIAQEEREISEAFLAD